MNSSVLRLEFTPANHEIPLGRRSYALATKSLTDKASAVFSGLDILTAGHPTGRHLWYHSATAPAELRWSASTASDSRRHEIPYPADQCCPKTSGRMKSDGVAERV